MKPLWFSEVWEKFQFPLYCTIRLDKNSNYYKTKELYEARLGSFRKPKDSKALHIVEIVGIRKMFLKDLTEALAQFDANMSKDRLTDLLKKWYQKQPQWAGSLTPLLVLFCLQVNKEEITPQTS